MYCSIWSWMKDPVTLAAAAVSSAVVLALGAADGGARAHAAAQTPATACVADAPSHHGLVHAGHRWIMAVVGHGGHSEGQPRDDTQASSPF